MSDAEERMDSDFESIDDEFAAKRMLRDAVKNGASTIAWTKNRESELFSNVVAYSEGDQTLHLLVPPNFEIKTQSEKQDWYFSVSVTRAILFFKTRFLGVDQTGLKFASPTRIYRAQRRKHLRFTIPVGRLVKVEFVDSVKADTKHIKNVIDLSEGGLAFEADFAEERFFTIGMPLRSLTFSIPGHKVIVDGIIRHVAPLPEASRFKGLKIGVEFAGLPEPMRKKISIWVIDECRKYFSKYF